MSLVPDISDIENELHRRVVALESNEVDIENELHRRVVALEQSRRESHSKRTDLFSYKPLHQEEITEEVRKLISSLPEVKYCSDICPSCTQQIFVPEGLDKEEYKYRCKNCDPSTTAEKYIWYDFYQYWTYSHHVYACPVCSREICGSSTIADHLEICCQHCNPSTEKQQYRWDAEHKYWREYFSWNCRICRKEIGDYMPRNRNNCVECDPDEEVHKMHFDGNEWKYDCTIYKCPTCKADIEFYMPLTDEEQLESIPYMCKNCDPSTATEKYRWDNTYRSWDLVKPQKVCVIQIPDDFLANNAQFAQFFQDYASKYYSTLKASCLQTLSYTPEP